MAVATESVFVLRVSLTVRACTLEESRVPGMRGARSHTVTTLVVCCDDRLRTAPPLRTTVTSGHVLGTAMEAQEHRTEVLCPLIVAAVAFLAALERVNLVVDIHWFYSCYYFLAFQRNLHEPCCHPSGISDAG